MVSDTVKEILHYERDDDTMIDAFYYPQADLIRIYLNRQEYDTINTKTGKSVYGDSFIKSVFDGYKIR